MKMQTISELRFSAADQAAFNASEMARNLTYTVMHKLRTTLVRMGLTKGKHEPIGPAVSPFDALRRTVLTKLDNDISRRLEATDQLSEYWGYHPKYGQTTGKFDELLNTYIKHAEGQSVPNRLQLLNDLIRAIN